MYAVYHNQGNVRGVVAIVKSLASAISIGSGASVGREGPIIQIGASFGSDARPRAQSQPLAEDHAAFRRCRRRHRRDIQHAAGRRALRGRTAPARSLSNRTFLPVVVATTTATSIARLVFGLSPAFFVPEATASSPSIRFCSPALPCSVSRPASSPGRLSGCSHVRGCFPHAARQRLYPKHHRHGADWPHFPRLPGSSPASRTPPASAMPPSSRSSTAAPRRSYHPRGTAPRQD